MVDQDANVLLLHINEEVELMLLQDSENKWL